MHINCLKEDLLYGIQVVGKAVSGKNILPILGGILISATDNKLIFRATDLDIAIECSIGADVLKPGSIVVADGRRFIEIVRQLPSGNINMQSINDFDVVLRYSKASLHINGLDTEEFPLLPKIEGEVQGNIKTEIFNRLIRQTIIAASTDNSRPVFTGILLDIKEDYLTMVATDSHRLTISKNAWNGHGNGRYIVPSRTMGELSRILSEESVNIVASQNHVYFQTEKITFVSRVINGQYPDYRQVLPNKNTYTTNVKINTQKFLESISRATLLARDNNSVVKLEFVKEDNIKMSASSPDIGDIKEEIDAVIEGESFSAAYNGRYLLDALKVMESENITIDLTGPVTPGLMRPELEEKDQSEYIYLILPIRVN